MLAHQASIQRDIRPRTDARSRKLGAHPTHISRSPCRPSNSIHDLSAATYRGAVRDRRTGVRQAIQSAPTSPTGTGAVVTGQFQRVVAGVLADALGQIRHDKAINYALNQWQALLPYCDHGIAEIDNNAAERTLRGVALGRKNFLFMGADSGGERAAAMYARIGTATLNGIVPEACFCHVLTYIADQPNH